ncbi:MAG TPA: molybdopterin-dependent oxidoreductase [Ktedonobacterales bacterium]|nr:molybdopterin-dependent oxidoreductase [Ktedonobacterales bacterium]
MSPRLTDWALALTAALALGTGALSLVSGHPEQWTVFAAHGVAGLWLALLLWDKLRRVLPRLLRPRLWDRRTALGALGLASVTLALGSGVWWVLGGDLALAGFGLLNWHILLGFLLAVALGGHMLARAKPLRQRDVRGRRQALRFGALLGGAIALWPAQQAALRALALPGARRRFTGSRDAGSFSGNAFPATSWVADSPLPIAPEVWRLRLTGAVARATTVAWADVATAGDDVVATLDCTSGFCSTQRWGGVRVGRLLDAAGLAPDAGWVSFISVTGYRWTLPLAEARGALLATHVTGEALAHEHGGPVRLVAPGRRGFQWVKWVVRVEARTLPDPGDLLAIHTSNFTPEGRGER